MKITMKTIIGIINGVDAQVKIENAKTISTLTKMVCEVTNNIGRPFKDWEVHTAAGKRLSKRMKISSLEDGQRLFFNLKVGIRGNICSQISL